MSEQNRIIAIVVFAVFMVFIALIGAVVQRDREITEAVSKSTNPILTRCALDGIYVGNNAALCTEALKKEQK